MGRLFGFREHPALAAAVVLTGLGFGFALVPRTSGPRVRGPAADGLFSAMPDSPSTVRVPAANLDPAALSELLATQRHRPAARRFAEEFLASPGPRAVWEGYLKDGDLQGAIARLRVSPEFRSLLERHSKDSEFSASVSALLSDPRLSRAMTEAEAFLQPAPPR